MVYSHPQSYILPHLHLAVQDMDKIDIPSQWDKLDLKADSNASLEFQAFRNDCDRAE